MATHSAIVHRTERTAHDVEIRFDDARWPRYVPLRLPWTQLVQERLPPGAAGVLVNRNHTHQDLILVLGAEEKPWFDAIDGRRTIADIADARDSQEEARVLFERLYWHDQVVFDACDDSRR